MRADLIDKVGVEKYNDRNILPMIRGGLVSAYLTCRDVSNNILRETREVAQSHTEFNTQRVKYILGETTRDAFKSKIARTYKTKNIIVIIENFKFLSTIINLFIKIII